METTKKFQYELERLFPNVDRQKFWDMFVDHEAYSESDVLSGEITIDKPGEGHPQGVGAVRSVVAGSMHIKEDIVGFQPPEYFRYETRNGSLPVNDFGGEFFFEDREDGMLLKYRGGFNPKYPGTGRLLQYFLRSRQRSVLLNLGEAYEAYYSTQRAGPLPLLPTGSSCKGLLQ